MNGTLAPIRVLLLEDSAGDARLIERRLEGHPVALERVTTLAEARSWLASNRADAVLLDLHVTDSEGFDTLRAVRALDDRLPIVVLTTFSSDAMGIDALQEGADDFVGKSDLTLVPLHRLLRHAIERKKPEWRIFSMVWRDAGATVLLDARGVVLFANPAAELLARKGTGELAGTDLGSQATAAQARIRLTRGDGSTVDVEARTIATTWRGQPAHVAWLREDGPE